MTGVQTCALPISYITASAAVFQSRHGSPVYAAKLWQRALELLPDAPKGDKRRILKEPGWLRVSNEMARAMLDTKR